MAASGKIWIIAGESSGDIYGARLAGALRKLNPDISISGMGGVEMKKAGIDIIVDSTELGVVGLVEVFSKIFKFIAIFLKLSALASKERPDAVVLIDYPGFNIRFAKVLKKKNIPVIWYISPQVWVWRKSNIPKLATYCRKMLVIFPFEPEVYKGSGLDVEFVGHPLVEIVRSRTDASISRDPSKVLLLPGSRFSEIDRLLIPVLETAAEMHRRRPDLKFILAAPRKKIYDKVLAEIAAFPQTHPGLSLPPIEVRCGETAKSMQEASCGLAASGTVTVECAISGLPLTVLYKLNPLTFFLAKKIIGKLFRNHFTMVNIIADRTVFEEFLQEQVQSMILADSLEKILPGGSRRNEVMKGIDEVIAAISCGSETASDRAAEACLEVVKSAKS